MAPEEIRFRINDATHGLTHFAQSPEFLFADDPPPLGDDDGQITVVVDMSEDGGRPVGVRSLTSSLMVTGFKWEPTAEPGRSAAALTVDGVSLERAGVAKYRDGPAGSGEQAAESAVHKQRLFAGIQRDARHLSRRVALLRQAMDNLEADQAPAA